MRRVSVPMVMMWLVLLLAVAVVTPGCGGAASQGKGDGPLVLDNGIKVWLSPVAGANQVVVVTGHPAGFLHEPKGMTQATHVLEHLACRAGTSHFAPGEAMRLLTARGQANAETMPDLTYYDFTVPPGDLELALRVAADRLGGVKITPANVAEEARNCYREADSVEQRPEGGMLKHAFMAFGQAWGCGATTVQVRGGLEQIPLADLERLYRAVYTPQTTVVAIAGGFDRAQAAALARKHLGSIPRSQAAPPAGPDWARVPKQQAVTWDAKVRAVCLGFPPPADAGERMVLSLWGGLVMNELVQEGEIKAMADAAFCSNQAWSVGTLPFFVYATAKEGVDPRALQARLASWLQRRAAQAGELDAGQMAMFAGQINQQPNLDWATIKQQGQMLAAQTGRTPEAAAGLIMGNLALQAALSNLTPAADQAKGKQALAGLTPAGLQSLLKRALAPSRGFVTYLAPAAG